MEDEELVDLDTSTQESEEEETSEEEEEETPKISPEEIEELRKKADLAENYKIRAEKAEKKIKEKPVEVKDEPELTTKDTLALVNAKIHEDDVEEVIKASKLLGKTVSETLKDKIGRAHV